MLNHYAVDIPTLPVNLCHSHLIHFLVECLAVLLECRAAEKDRQAFGTHMIYRETFLQIQLRPLQHLIRRNGMHGFLEEKNRFTHPQWKRVRQTQDQDPVWTVSQTFCHLQRMRLFEELWADQQRLQISDLHFDKFPTPATFACWKIRFNTEVCTCSQFPTEAMQWIKEVEMVELVDELKTSSSVRGIPVPGFEVRCEDCFSAEQNHP